MPTDDLPLGPKFEKALSYASRAHSSQRRKGGGIPYVAHLLSVAALVIEDGGTESEAIAALLHDVIEDQGGLERREEILSLFGEEVVRIVDGCTDSWESPRPPWRQRKESHIRNLRQAPADVLRVAAADKLHNARSILLDLRVNGDTIWTRFRGGKDGTLWYYRTIGALLEEAAAGPMVDELIRVVREMENLAAGDGSGR